MHHKLDTFYVIGIAVRTTNENQKAAQDIPVLWNKFMTEGIINQIPNKADHAIYCIYTDYEKDYTKPYTTILGCKVNSSILFLKEWSERLLNLQIIVNKL